MGGVDKKENIAILTPREHYICHLLLYKIHRNKQMLFALFLMSNPLTNSAKGVRVPSRVYEKLRKEYIKKISGKGNHNYGKERDPITREKISIGLRKWNLNNEHYLKGIKKDIGFSERMRNANKVRIVSEETKRKISKSKKGSTYGPMSEAQKEKLRNKKLGHLNPMFDKNIYCFIHPLYGEERCTRNELVRKYNLNNGHISSVINGKRRRHKKWEVKS